MSPILGSGWSFLPIAHLCCAVTQLSWSGYYVMKKKTPGPKWVVGGRGDGTGAMNGVGWVSGTSGPQPTSNLSGRRASPAGQVRLRRVPGVLSHRHTTGQVSPCAGGDSNRELEWLGSPGGRPGDPSSSICAHRPMQGCQAGTGTILQRFESASSKIRGAGAGRLVKTTAVTACV